MPVSYEWDVETIDQYGDIQDHDHVNNLNDLPAWITPESIDGDNRQLVLVRDKGDEYEGLTDRQWAYATGLFLGSHFDGGAKVPERFHTELQRWREG